MVVLCAVAWHREAKLIGYVYHCCSVFITVQNTYCLVKVKFSLMTAFPVNCNVMHTYVVSWNIAYLRLTITMRVYLLLFSLLFLYLSPGIVLNVSVCIVCFIMWYNVF